MVILLYFSLENYMIVDLFVINSSDYVVDCKFKINMFFKKVLNLKKLYFIFLMKKLKKLFFVFLFDISFGIGFGLRFLKS